MMPSKRVILEQICVFQRKNKQKKKVNRSRNNMLRRPHKQTFLWLATIRTGAHYWGCIKWNVRRCSWPVFDVDGWLNSPPPPLVLFLQQREAGHAHGATSCAPCRGRARRAQHLSLHVGDVALKHSSPPFCEAAVDLDGFVEFRWRSSTTCGTTLPSSKARFFLAPAAHLIKYRNSRWGKCNLVFHCAHQDAGLFALFPSGNGSCKKLKDSRTTFPLRQ